MTLNACKSKGNNRGKPPIITEAGPGGPESRGVRVVSCKLSRFGNEVRGVKYGEYYSKYTGNSAIRLITFRFKGLSE